MLIALRLRISVIVAYLLGFLCTFRICIVNPMLLSYTVLNRTLRSCLSTPRVSRCRSLLVLTVPTEPVVNSVWGFCRSQAETPELRAACGRCSCSMMWLRHINLLVAGDRWRRPARFANQLVVVSPRFPHWPNSARTVLRLASWPHGFTIYTHRGHIYAGTMPM